MADVTLIQQRLRDGALDDLVGMGVDFLMRRPVTELLDPEWVADQVVANVETAASRPEVEEWVRGGVNRLREQVPSGVPGDNAPAEVIEPLRGVLARPYLPDRDLIGRLVNHAAMERIFKDVLSGALRDFAHKLSRMTPSSGHLSKGFSRLRSLQRRAQQGVLGGLSSEIERQAESRIRDYVDKSISRTLAQVADHLCDPRYAELYGDFRIHLLNVVLETPNASLVSELDKLDPDELVATGAAVARTVARRDGLRDEIAAVARAVLDGAGGRSLQDFLDESGMQDDWRPEVEGQLLQQARDFIETDAFTSWLDALIDV
ncbi:MAG: hypothetical protein AAFV53_23555 [Myxococcota bacterium]